MDKSGKGDGAAAGRPKRPRGRPPTEGPTERQREILDFIRAAGQADRRPPTIEEIRRHFRFRSTFAVRAHLDALERKGLLSITRKSHRGINLPDAGGEGRDEAWLVPLLGDAPAGMPLEAMERADEHIALDPALFPRREDLFAIRVRGDSMIGAGILDRDLALIRPGREAKDGDLVLARLNNEVTIKRLRRAGGEWYLHPENPNYPDIRAGRSDELAVIGTVAGIVRKY